MNPLDEGAKQNEAATSESPAAGAPTTKGKECEEVLAVIEKGFQNPEEGYFEKAARELILNTAKDQISKLIQQETDSTKLAAACAEIKKTLGSGETGAQN